MANESINLNLIPEGEMPVIHSSQFDNGRQFTINLLKGSDEYSMPEGYTATLNCRKLDRNIVTLATTSVLSNVLTFTTTTQLCACAGKNLCEVVIKDAEDYQVGTSNFILEVEKDPLQGGIESTSEIHDLTNQIEEITTEIVGENYYTKTETDTMLDAKANTSDLAVVATSGSYLDLDYKPSINGMRISGNRTGQYYGLADLSAVYTKSQVDTALSAKANTADLATVATTGSYTDLTNKPDIPAAQVQSDYAQSDNTQVDFIKNKPDINGMIAAAIYEIMPESTVTGSVASFNTDFEKPLTALTVGNSATKLFQMGGSSHNAPYFKGIYNGNYNFVDLGTLTLSIGARNNDNTGYIFYAYLQDILPTAHTYKEGIIDNLTWDYQNTWEDLKVNEFMIGSYLIICADYSTPESLKAAMSGHYLIYELDTAVTPSITDTQFNTLCAAFNAEHDIYTLPVSTNPTTYNGDNNFFTDNGNITVSYKESIQHYVDRKAGT